MTIEIVFNAFGMLDTAKCIASNYVRFSKMSGEIFVNGEMPLNEWIAKTELILTDLGYDVRELSKQEPVKQKINPYLF